MKCEEFQQAIAADPAFDGGVDHVATCVDCAEFAADVRTLNVRIAKALDLAVPDVSMPELPAIETDNVVSLPSRRMFNTPTMLAIAASVLMAAFIGLSFNEADVSNDSLVDQVLAHMDHEPGSLRVTSNAVSDSRLARVVPAKVATMNHDAGLITYAQSCEINGRSVPHLVIQGKNGPITILLMPEESVETAQDIKGESIQGVIVPVGGGSIAIIGSSDEELEDVKSNVLDSVNWST